MHLSCRRNDLYRLDATPLVSLFTASTMNSIKFQELPSTPYPTGTYVLLHHGILPPDGLVLSQVKVVGGWPNPVLEASRQDGAPAEWLKAVDDLALSNDRPDFNMGVYQVNGINYPAAVYGTLEGWLAPSSQQELFRDRLRTVPDKYQHLAHLF